MTARLRATSSPYLLAPPVAGVDASKNYLHMLFNHFDPKVEYTSEEVVAGETVAFDRGTASAEVNA